MGSKVPSLAGAGETPLSFSGVFSLEIRFRHTAYLAHFVIANQLTVNKMVKNWFLKTQLKTIDFEIDVLVFKRGSVVVILSSSTQDGDGTLCTTQSAP